MSPTSSGKLSADLIALEPIPFQKKMLESAQGHIEELLEAGCVPGTFALDWMLAYENQLFQNLRELIN
jgi:hypothetical protein